MRNELPNEIEKHLPYLRRYARAMTGSQERGDTLAAETLVTILSDLSVFHDGIDPKIALFRVLLDNWGNSPSAFANDITEAEASAQILLSNLTPGSRHALLLCAIEQFSNEEIGMIMRRNPTEIDDLVKVARLDIAKAISGRVLVIEDEAAVAHDIENIVSEMGHTVIGTAPTKKDALHMVKYDEPDLIMSDIQLADDSSGIDAVGEILTDYPKKPVIFLTGFPERLLTGTGNEPAFLINKPYSPDQVRSAVSQAMFFSPRKTLV